MRRLYDGFTFVIFTLNFFNKMDKFIIVGKAASGKDWLQKEMIKRGYVPMKQYTTREMRENETGNEYHFISQEEFEHMKEEGRFVSARRKGITGDASCRCSGGGQYGGKLP